jgi:RNA polymerase sigma-70 factor (ECF subfamily)
MRQPPTDRPLSEAELELFEALWRTNEKGIHRYVCRLLGPDADGAEDVVQETFKKAWIAFPRFRPINPRSWLYVIATNETRRHQQRERSKWQNASLDNLLNPAPEDDSPALLPKSLSCPSPEEAVIQRELLRQVMRELGDEERLCLYLRYQAGFSVDEIATRLELPPYRVRRCLASGLIKFRALHSRLSEDNYEGEPRL